MTLPPEKIGDKGQRFQIKYSADVDAMDDKRCLGYASTHEGAEQMAAAWRKHPQGYYVWIVDRESLVVDGITAQFRTFGGGSARAVASPISVAMQDGPPVFALGVDVREVVRFVMEQMGRL